jgi:hypothetical protein
MVPRSLVALLACCTVAGSAAPPAAAQGGGGLYAPFPEPRAGDQAQNYVEQLGIRASRADLKTGRMVGPGARWTAGAASPAASPRAGVHSGSSVALLGSLLAALALAVVVDRRRWS